MNILKTLVDIVWIFSIPLILIIVFAVPAIFFMDLGDLPITINGLDLTFNDTFSKSLGALAIFSYLPVLASLYLFKTTLRYFRRVKMFDIMVIKNFNKIGILLIASGAILGISTFLLRTIYQQRVEFSVGLSPFFLLLGFGLFFMVLSETFKIAKAAKEENDLTV